MVSRRILLGALVSGLATAAPLLLLLSFLLLLSCAALALSLACAPAPDWVVVGGVVVCAYACVPKASAMAAPIKDFFIVVPYLTLDGLIKIWRQGTALPAR